jgi:hypothetical protein
VCLECSPIDDFKLVSFDIDALQLGDCGHGEYPLSSVRVSVLDSASCNVWRQSLAFWKVLSIF